MLNAECGMLNERGRGADSHAVLPRMLESE
jgi:hypothetical protein